MNPETVSTIPFKALGMMFLTVSVTPLAKNICIGVDTVCQSLHEVWHSRLKIGQRTLVRNREMQETADFMLFQMFDTVVKIVFSTPEPKPLTVFQTVETTA